MTLGVTCSPRSPWPSWPCAPRPKEYAWPSSLSARVWARETDTLVTRTAARPGTTVGTATTGWLPWPSRVVMPSTSSSVPHVSSRHSVLMNAVWQNPAATVVRQPARSRSSARSSPCVVYSPSISGSHPPRHSARCRRASNTTDGELWKVRLTQSTRAMSSVDGSAAPTCDSTSGGRSPSASCG
eukprot:2475239-Prymnesium_polylepis.1